jgi:O-antigen biosynthesis protein
MAKTPPITSTDDHSERFLPHEMTGPIVREHVGRYEFAASYVRGRNVVDAACGAGYGAKILIDAGARSYTGIDISADAVTLARRQVSTSNARFLHEDATKLPSISDASIDVVVSFETIEHVEDPAQLLTSFRRVLSPGGTFLVSTPNRLISNPRGSIHSLPPNRYHVREWTERELLELLRGHFVIEDVLGQAPVSHGRRIARRLATHRPLTWLRSAYRAARAMRSANATSNGAPIPVVRTPRGTVPTYLVCVCRRR